MQLGSRTISYFFYETGEAPGPYRHLLVKRSTVQNYKAELQLVIFTDHNDKVLEARINFLRTHIIYSEDAVQIIKKNIELQSCSENAHTG